MSPESPFIAHFGRMMHAVVPLQRTVVSLHGPMGRRAPDIGGDVILVGDLEDCCAVERSVCMGAWRGEEGRSAGARPWSTDRQSLLRRVRWPAVGTLSANTRC